MHFSLDKSLLFCMLLYATHKLCSLILKDQIFINLPYDTTLLLQQPTEFLRGNLNCSIFLSFLAFFNIWHHAVSYLDGTSNIINPPRLTCLPLFVLHNSLRDAPNHVILFHIIFDLPSKYQVTSPNIISFLFLSLCNLILFLPFIVA